MRDVFRLFDARLGLMLDEDDPLFANWDQDETAVAERYGDQDPAVVAAELAAAGERRRGVVRRRRRRAVGAASGGAATAPCSPCGRSPATSSTTPSTTCYDVEG